MPFVTDMHPRGLSAGGPPSACTPTMPWTLQRCPSGNENVKELISLSWCITCDRSVQHSSIRYGVVLAEADAAASVGTKDHSFRLHPGRDTELPTQGRGHPQPIPLAGQQRCRGRHRRVDAPVQHHPAALRHRHAKPTEHKGARVADVSQNNQEQSQPATTDSR